ncbi:MAG: hypothetical protein ABIR37_04365 [Candidatus Saccharimonadales bacterium]
MTDNAAQTTSGSAPRRRRATSAARTPSQSSSQPPTEGSKEGINDEVAKLMDRARKEVQQHRANVAKLQKLDESDELDNDVLLVAAGLLKEQHKMALDKRSASRTETQGQIRSFQQRFGNFQTEPAPRQLDSAPVDNPPAPPADNTADAATDRSGTLDTTSETDDTKSVKKIDKLQQELAKDKANQKEREPRQLLGLAGYKIQDMDKVYAKLGIKPGTTLTHQVLQDAVDPSQDTASKDKSPTVVTLRGLGKKLFDAAKGSPKASNTGSQTRS